MGAQAQKAEGVEAAPAAPYSVAVQALDPTLQGAFKKAVPPYRFQFPRDHAAHPEYQTEWWYYTGHLESGTRRFGYELTFFQVGINPWRKSSKSAWALHTVYFAHFTVTDENNRKFQFTEEITRPALGMAGADTDRYRVWLHDWSASLLSDNRTHHLVAGAPEFAIDLNLEPLKPPVVHGRDGVSQKSAGVGRASHYYSLTRMGTRGTLRLNGEELPVTGVSWMDHEFGSNQLSAEQAGWDWFSLQLDDGRELMLYRLRLKNGGVEPLSSGTLVAKDGTWKHLPLSAFEINATGQWKSPKSGAVYPQGWTVRVPSEGINLTLEATVADQELVPEGVAAVRYWEGSVRVTGSATGVGYAELTGYSKAIPKF
ncbi:MAG: lipocalin-like domain-containing protein [Actinomycetota bacterium]